MFLYRAGALYPAYRTSTLLDDLRGRLVRPVTLLYPGRLSGEYGLRFMDRNEPRLRVPGVDRAQGGICMKIKELFRRDIHRVIEEVIKVDVGDENIIADELDEYVATEHILEELETVLDAYQESINSPNETCAVWVSGFFGSGKSSWAKVLGYLLWNPVVMGESAADRFFRTDILPPPASIAQHDPRPSAHAGCPAESGDRIQCRGQGGRIGRPAGLPRFAGPARLLP